MKTTEATTNIITNAFNKWADKRWFQALVIIVVIYLMAAPVLGPVINNLVSKQSMSETITTTLNERDKESRRIHKLNFESSRQAYALAKHRMQDYLPLTKSEYIFLIEYHNGSENVMTGIQFCRFDMTIEVSDNTTEYVPIEKFRDDIVARYDLLLSEELGKNKLLYYRQNEFKDVDKYLSYQLSTINAKSYAVLNLKDRDGKVFGSVLCVSTNDTEINLLNVRELALELEDIFNKNIYQEDEHQK